MKDSYYFKKVLVKFGFTIERRSDDELLECLIGLTQFELLNGLFESDQKMNFSYRNTIMRTHLNIKKA
jgi:hypothetical protein